MNRQQAIEEIEIIDQTINFLKKMIIAHPKNSDKYKAMIAEADKEIIELCNFVFSRQSINSGGYGCPFTTTEHIMHLIPTINAHHRAISFDRFMGMFNSIPQQQDHTFKSERWYVLSQCEQHIYSVVIYFCQFDKCIQYNAQRVR